MEENQAVNMQNGNIIDPGNLFVQNLNNDGFLQNIFHILQQANPVQFGEMNFDTFRGLIQENVIQDNPQDVIQDNPQDVIERFRNFIGGQEVAQEMDNVVQNNAINDINLDDIVNQLRDTFYKIDSLSKSEYENRYINKQIKIIEKSAINNLKNANKAFKQKIELNKSMLQLDKKISKIGQDVDKLITYRNKLKKSKNNLFNILLGLSSENRIINDQINIELSEKMDNLQLPTNLQQGYEPNFINKRQISKVLKDTEKTFNKAKSAINEIDTELQGVKSQIADMN